MYAKNVAIYSLMFYFNTRISLACLCFCLRKHSIFRCELKNAIVPRIKASSFEISADIASSIPSSR